MKPISPLSDRCKAILLGSVLGDGSLKLHKGYRNARFSFRHSAVQRDYFLWKVAELKEISAAADVWEQNGADGWGQDKLRYQSAALPALTDLYRLVCPHRKLEIRRKWLNQLTPLALCVWWLDDGSLLNGKQGVFCTDGFSCEEQLLLVRYLRVVWGLNPRIGRVATTGPRSSQFRIWLRSRDELVRFLRIILPHFAVPSLLKKVVLLDRDPDVQQRWISEVSQATGLSDLLIRSCVQEQKAKLARFRE